MVTAKVRLLRDFHTRGGRIFRKGVVMTVGSIDREYYLECTVRAVRYHLRMAKVDAPRYFEVISVPELGGDE